MTEKEKMLCGTFYDTRDSELRRLSNRAKDLMRIYNNLPAENMELRNQIIHLLFGFCGENARVNQPIWVDYGCNLSRCKQPCQYELHPFRYRQNHNR